MTRNPALSLFNDLLADLREGNLFMQIAVVAACLGVAWVIARWWQGRQEEGAGRLRDASARLAFPISAMVLVGVALLALKPIIHVNLLKIALPLLGSLALVRSVVFVLRQAFPKATWLTAWERVIAACVWGWLALYITDLAPDVIDAMESVQFALGKQKLNLWMIVHGAITVFLTVVVALWVAGVIERKLMRVDHIDSSLRIVGVRVAKALLAVAALLTSFSLVGIDMTALSVFTGALGGGLGLGLQKIASNYVSGFIILLDRSIRIGNFVQIGNDTGEVTQITTRYTVLRHPGGAEFIVPNETLIASTVQNQTFSDKRLRLATTIGVAYDSDLERVSKLMVDAARATPRVLADPAPRAFLVAFADSAINLELGFWIADPEEGRGNVLSDVNFAVWRAFRENGVTIPFPQRDVHIRDAAPVGPQA